MSTHPSLRGPPTDLVNGRWIALAGAEITSRNPARPAEIVWSGTPDPGHADAAVAAASEAFKTWSAWSPSKRHAVLRRFADLCKARAAQITALIRDETGKAEWDAAGEASLLAAKVDATLAETPDAPLRRVAGYKVELTPTRQGRCWFRPHGVMAVLAPFNFPMHLPNGHIVPALALGNTVVLKPSDKTPAAGQMLGELYQEALDAEGAPPGVVNVVQGGAASAQRLARHPGVDGVLFTGSWPVGRAILEANLDTPGRICALEMGGNNAAVVLPDADLRQAVVECVRSAFITSGQRCTCTRRLIVHEAVADRVIRAVCRAASELKIGDPASGEPVFLGPVISEAARRAILGAQASLARGDGRILLECRALDREGWFLTPGVMQVERFVASDAADVGAGADVEVFGPLLRVAVVRSLDEAIEQANATRFGLAAAIFTKDERAIERFLREARAGCINVNTGSAGASGRLPFGGLGRSGNHRPAGALSVDYCAYPVAGLVEWDAAATMHPGMTFDPAWLS